MVGRKLRENDVNRRLRDIERVGLLVDEPGIHHCHRIAPSRDCIARLHRPHRAHRARSRYSSARRFEPLVAGVAWAPSGSRNRARAPPGSRVARPHSVCGSRRQGAAASRCERLHRPRRARRAPSRNSSAVRRRSVGACRRGRGGEHVVLGSPRLARQRGAVVGL
jgi:hypothetical protein